MSIHLRQCVCVLCAALFLASHLTADDASELADVKRMMEEVQGELGTLRARMQDGGASERSHAGGVPDSLRSRNGKAFLRVGGSIETTYRATWQDSDPHNFRYRRFSDNVAITSTALNFQADFTPDTTLFLQLRLDAAQVGGNAGHGGVAFIDEAWWQWRNLCNTGVNLRVGRMKIPFGEQFSGVLPLNSYNDNGVYPGMASYAGTGRMGEMTNPARTLIWTPGATYGVGYEFLSHFGDFTLRTAMFDGNVNSYGGGGEFTRNNRAQYSASINAAVKLQYEPSMLEGLYLSASYLGVHNYGRDAGSTVIGGQAIADPRAPYAANYAPYFNLAAAYTHGKWNFFFENTMGWNAGLLNSGTNPGVTVYGGSFVNTMTVGATYNWNARLSLTGMFDWGHLSTGGRSWNAPGGVGNTRDFRAAIGAQYDFGNGILLQGAYSHTWSYWSVENAIRHTDELVLRTLVQF